MSLIHLRHQRTVSGAELCDRGEVPIGGCLRMRKPGAGVLRVVGRQPTARRDGKVIDDRSNAEGSRTAGGPVRRFVDEAEAGDDGVEEAASSACR